VSDFFWPARHRRRAAVFELGDQPLYPAAAAIGPTEHEADRAAATTCSAEKAARTRAADDASFDELNGADDARLVGELAATLTFA
jgi:hypothetical protein